MYATELAAKVLEPSVEEERLAEDYVTILGSLSAMEQALRDGDWHRLRDEADELMSAAEEMWAGIPLAEEETDVVIGRQATPADRGPDSAKVRQLIAVYARPYDVGRALYPTRLIEDTQLRTAAEEDEPVGAG